MRKIFFILFWLFIFSPTIFADELIIEPEAGRAPLLSAIAHAKSSLQLVMYGFTDQSLMQAFIQAKNTGKNVQILLEAHPYKSESENFLATHLLNQNQVTIFSSNPEFKLTHQKTLLIDHEKAFIMTFNFTHSTFKNERNFALVITTPALVQEIKHVFLADLDHRNITVKQPDLVWSPNNAREKLLTFIRDSHTEIKMYEQDIKDYKMVGALKNAAQSGVKIKIMTSLYPHSSRNKAITYLEKNGVEIRYSKHYQIHAKVIMSDHTRALLGSINLTTPSIDENRELSVITHDANVIQQLEKTFDHDWAESSAKKIKPTNAWHGHLGFFHHLHKLVYHHPHF